MVICHCRPTGLKGLKCAVVCYFHGRIFKPTNFLNPRGAFYRINDANVSNLIFIITALCNNLEHLRLTRELGDVKSERTSHNFSLFAIFLLKLSKLVEI